MINCLKHILSKIILFVLYYTKIFRFCFIFLNFMFIIFTTFALYK